MPRRRILLRQLARAARCSTFASLLAIAAVAAQEEFTPIFSAASYGLSASSPFFSGEPRTWLETSVRFGARVAAGPLAFEAAGLGVHTSGRDPFGTGSAPAGAPSAKPAPSRAPQLALDTLHVLWRAAGALPLTLTIGRQPLVLGSQFVIGDGVYDGFHPHHGHGVWHNPRRGFDAARLEFAAAGTRADAFVYRQHPTWDGGAGRNGSVAGLEFTRPLPAKGTASAALLRRDSRTSSDNDVWLPAVRIAQPVPGCEGWTISGEWVGQLGRGRHPYYVSNPGRRIKEQAWHAELGWQGERLPGKPFAEAGCVYYSPDFTPLATGFAEWGKWYLGNQIDWIIFGTDSRIFRAQAGCSPHAKLKTRVLYHHTRHVSRGGPLSDELTLVAEYTPSAKWWMNLALGYARPRATLAGAGLTNPFSFLNSAAVPVGAERSLDLVLAAGFSL